MRPKFRVGDKVRVIQAGGLMYPAVAHGTEGTIQAIYSNPAGHGTDLHISFVVGMVVLNQEYWSEVIEKVKPK